tara:strand:+ start:2509 stop:2616 length:108 start_codon:yes stop_codon:yes gene_type:complete
MQRKKHSGATKMAMNDKRTMIKRLAVSNVTNFQFH